MTGLLILTIPLQRIIPNLPKILASSAKCVKERLYIHLDPICKEQSPKEYFCLPFNNFVISSIYSISPSLCPNIDIRILLHGFKSFDEFLLNYHGRFDTIIYDGSNENITEKYLERYKRLLRNELTPLFSLDLINSGEILKESDVINDDNERIYDDVAAGGTFDGIHQGHKILLSCALLRTRQRLTIGMAKDNLLKNKLLKELIKPCSIRMNDLNDFLSDIDNSVCYNLVEIDEPMGPTGWDPKIELIVVSEETKKAVDLINSHRKEQNLRELESYTIQLYEDLAHDLPDEEAKFSSSSLRMRRLGTRIRKPASNSSIPKFPYIIGLTGGSASGKTKIAQRLKELGAGIVDCDKQGHKAYIKGSSCYLKLVQNFGKEILLDDGEVNRKELGRIVFSDSTKLQQLNEIVWPEIANLVNEEIKEFEKNGSKVVVLDAAVLLKSGWDKLCHEVWVTILPRQESVKRIVERDGLTEEQAIKRLQSQVSNDTLVSKAHIVFCSQWSYKTTQRQVEKAWNILCQENYLDDDHKSASL